VSTFVLWTNRNDGEATGQKPALEKWKMENGKRKMKEVFPFSIIRFPFSVVSARASEQISIKRKTNVGVGLVPARVKRKRINV
jgi:hypothetical protein